MSESALLLLWFPGEVDVEYYHMDGPHTHTCTRHCSCRINTGPDPDCPHHEEEECKARQGKVEHCVTAI